MLRSKILGLYKSLIRYSETLQFTDKKYFVHRVRKGFLANRELKDKAQIEFHYKVFSRLSKTILFKNLHNIIAIVNELFDHPTEGDYAVEAQESGLIKRCWAEYLKNIAARNCSMISPTEPYSQVRSSPNLQRVA